MSGLANLMGRRRILCVDDEPNLLEGIKRQLRREFDVSTALGGEEALGLIQRDGSFPVVMSDYNMPRMDGVAFLRRVRELSPDTVTIMLTGRAELNVAVDALHRGNIFRFLSKPVSNEVLVRSIEDAFAQHRLISAERELTAQLNRANEDLQGLNQVLEAKVAERTRTLRRLFEFVTELNGLDSLAAVAQLTVSAASEMLASPLVSLWDYEPSSGMLTPIAASDPNVCRLPGLPVESCLAGRVLFERALQVFETADQAQLQEADGTYLLDFPVLAVPLAVNSLGLGMLMLSGTARGQFSEEAIVTVHSLAKSASIALLAQQHRKERDETQDAVIMALAKLSEYRDPETGRHLLRLKRYCRMLCESLKDNPRYGQVITPAFIEDVVRSSPLHDIGKVGIPDHILKKPGRHSPEEFELMKTHAAIGGDTLRSVLEDCKYQGFIKTGMDIAYCHHERWDGRGYPKGLRGQDIPLAARVLALADVYDALTTARVYKPSFPHEQARQIILDGRGEQFDPDVVDAFMRREAVFAETAEELADGADCLM